MNTMIVVAYPDQSTGDDPEALGLSIMGVMICLNQEDLHSLSASSRYQIDLQTLL